MTLEMPREKLRHKGADSLQNSELLAIILRTGVKGASAIVLAEKLLHEFHSLEALASASLEQLQSQKGIGGDKAIALKSAFTLAKRLAHEKMGVMPSFEEPNNVADFLREELRLLPQENLYLLLLNTRNRLIKTEVIGKGTIDSLLVHPREVFRPAIQSNAASIILVHNHPSGDPTPSEPDIRVTKEIVEAGNLLRIKVHDHIIIGKQSNERSSDFVSMKTIGLI